MRKILSICLMSLVGFHFCYSQDEKHNLEKYWRYKERFEKSFIVLPTDKTSGADAAGISIPALTWKLDNTNKKNSIDFTDGNANLSHYLSMLATEYRLLKNGGYNYDQTINQLYYVFTAIDRLDQNSESFFRADGSVQSSDKNGWMIRDDVTPQFWQNNCAKLGLPGASVTQLTSGYYNPGDYDKESFSQDNVYHLLEGLALVNKLVSAEYVDVARYADSNGVTRYGKVVDFPALAKDITTRLITMMQHSESFYLAFVSKPDSRFECLYSPPTWWQWVIAPDWSTLDLTLYDVFCKGFNSQWYIRNPVTNQFAFQGSGSDFSTWAFYSYGLVRAGNKITNTSFDFDKSSESMQNKLFTGWFNGSYTGTVDNVATAISIPVSDFLSSLLVGIPAPLPPGAKNDLIKKLAYSIAQDDPYKVKTLATVGNVFGEDTFWNLRNVELIEKQGRYVQFMLTYILLHGAPAAYSPSSPEYINDKAYFLDLLSQAPCKGPRNFQISSGDDFNKEWSVSSRLVWPERRGLQTDPNSKQEYNGLDYMFLHNLYCMVYQADFRKLTVSAVDPFVNQAKTETAVDIIASDNISGTSNVNDYASNSIRLIPGFQAVTGSTFDAKIVSSNIDYKGITQSNPCTYTYAGRKTEEVVNDYDEEFRKSVSSKGVILVPNPSNGTFTVVLTANAQDESNKDIAIYDITGKIVYRDSFVGSSKNINVTGKGIYIVTIKSRVKTYQDKLIIE